LLPRRFAGVARLLGAACWRGSFGERTRVRGSRRAQARAPRRRLGRRAAHGARARRPARAPHPRLRGRAGIRLSPRAERAPAARARLHARVGGARRAPRRLLRLRPVARRARDPGGGHRAPRRLGVAARGARGLAQKVMEGGGQPTPVIDRFYFKSIYFREPSGVLFEIATIGPGFTADEPFETLGESLSLPPNYERYRAQVEQILTPLPNPRRDRSRASGEG